MRAVVQRVVKASVRVDGDVVGAIGPGMLLLVAVAGTDAPLDAKVLADKVAGLRVFSDDVGKMNLSLLDVGGEALVVSQFTLYGDVRRGRRPSFSAAAEPELGRALIAAFVESLESAGVKVDQGVFGAHMDVELVNDGPVTLVIDAVGGRIL